MYINKQLRQWKQKECLGVLLVYLRVYIHTYENGTEKTGLDIKGLTKGLLGALRYVVGTPL
jgi:hypothetical protein